MVKCYNTMKKCYSIFLSRKHRFGPVNQYKHLTCC